jgi:transcriptional regulator with XRE-family HTH domain
MDSMALEEVNDLVVTRALPAAEATVKPFNLGQRVRDLRQRRSWTLEEVSRRTGLARSTLSKIENEQMSPTFDAVQKLAAGLGIDIPQLFVPAETAGSAGRRTVTRAGDGRPRPTATYEHELICTELTQKKMVPFKSRIRAHSFDEFPDWVRHEGEELLLVLEGRIALYTEFYEPVELAVGDSAYFDSNMGHAVISVGDPDALVLWVCTA